MAARIRRAVVAVALALLMVAALAGVAGGEHNTAPARAALIRTAIATARIETMLCTAQRAKTICMHAGERTSCTGSPGAIHSLVERTGYHLRRTWQRLSR